jgi:hypothetical protein
MLEYLAPVPPWLLLAVALGIALAGCLRLLLPRQMPGLFASSVLLSVGLAVGHLIAVTGDLPTWQIGNLRVVYGLGLACLLLWLAKSRLVW